MSSLKMDRGVEVLVVVELRGGGRLLSNKEFGACGKREGGGRRKGGGGGGSIGEGGCFSSNSADAGACDCEKGLKLSLSPAKIRSVAKSTKTITKTKKDAI